MCNLSLETPSGDDATMIQSDGVVEAMLYGTLVAAPTEMTDQAGASGIYFAFPDVSVRYVGEFRIRANVMRITGCVDLDLSSAMTEHSGQALDSTLTTTFDVVEPSDYVAPRMSTSFVILLVELMSSADGSDETFRCTRDCQIRPSSV